MNQIPFNESDIEIDTARIKVRLIGSVQPDRPVWVFLHEGLGSITQWRDFPEALCAATGYGALLYDRPGYGRSSSLPQPWPDDFLIKQAHLFPRLLDRLGITKPLLFGHSDGGTLALMIASLYPTLPLATVTEAAHVLIEPITKQGLRALYDKTKTDPDFATRLLRHHPQYDVSFIQNWVQTWLRPSLSDWNMLDMLGAVTCPLLALQGALDEHGSADQITKIINGVKGPSQALIIPACGHVPHLEARQSVLDSVTDFLNKLALPKA
jgi:pimeloyl-ACP methyl ester carboxylesterase